ncbi:MAG: DUF1540 domain-containing protein [Christensenellales bacterium]
MKKILCHTSNCEHNLKNTCFAGVISIGETAKCMSKIKRDGGVLAQAFADVEASEELDKLSDTEAIVGCDANCIYNHDRVCSCEEIVVDDKLLSTKCKTRIVSKSKN